MKHLDEYRDASAVRRLADEIAAAATRPWTIMEVCGGQTHSIVRFGLDALLPPSLTLVHGPGCPVCVTPSTMIDSAIALSLRPGVLLCSFGDMLRVPGTREDLLRAKAAGGGVRVVYSPMDALRLAEENPGREVVFFAVGFETTAPANALALREAKRRGVGNFSMLCSHVLVPPAMEAILADPDCRVQGFLAAGHVCAVMGWEEYAPLAARHGVPVVVTGFEPVDLLGGVLLCVRQLEEGRAEVENAYARWVRREGNAPAQALLREVFRVVPREWRGIGEIPASGLGLAEAYAEFDAARRFGLELEAEGETGTREAAAVAEAEGGCLAGLVLQGRIKPADCPQFGTRCTPDRPLGAPMVSDEGACAAYFRYRGEVG
jgi:hydrogenase expression/formation protein HypD